MTTLDLGRVRGLTAANTKVLLRNRLATFYGFAVPLLALGLLFLQKPDENTSAGSTTVATALLMALLFPVFYNVLSAVVTRRDELVLKRLRTGQARDPEILLSIALPGVVIALGVTLVAMVVVPLLGFAVPANAPLLLLGMLLGCAAFVALALWTAAWTRNAEAAQLTSAPVIFVSLAGAARPFFGEDAQRWLVLLPNAALEDLVRASWFGMDSADRPLSFVDTFGHSLPALGSLALWAVVGSWLGSRSMRWEPRA